jgi:hypothetical protein
VSVREIVLPGGHRVQFHEDDSVSFVHGRDGRIRHPYRYLEQPEWEVLVGLVRLVLGTSDSVLTIRREALEEVYLRGYLDGDGNERVVESDLRAFPDWFVEAREAAISRVLAEVGGTDACPDLPGAVGGGDVDGTPP